MRNNEEIKCAKCGKVIGRYIYEGGMNSALGFIPTYSMKMDYRKASHLAITKSCKHVCKTCVRKDFKEGKAYEVNFNYHGKEMSIQGNSEYYNVFTTLKDAQEACDEMNNKKLGIRYWVEEKKI